MKGRTSFSELSNMPYKYLHTLYYKAWLESTSPEAQKAAAGEEMEEAMEEMMDR